MNHLIAGTTNLINKLGDSLVVTTNYIVEIEPSIGDEEITLREVDGLIVDATISINEEDHLITAISGKVITIDPELESAVYYNQVLTCSSEVKGLPVPRFKRVTYELLEFIRKVRVPIHTVVTYGSTVTLFEEKFYVVGMDPGDHSYSLTLKEINANITIKRIETTGFDSLNRDLEEDLIAADIPANMRFDRSDLPMRSNVGYLQQGSFYCMIPKNFPVTDPHEFILEEILPGDIIVSENDRYKIAGFDKFTNKNFIALVLVLDPSK